MTRLSPHIKTNKQQRATYERKIGSPDRSSVVVFASLTLTTTAITHSQHSSAANHVTEAWFIMPTTQNIHALNNVAKYSFGEIPSSHGTIGIRPYCLFLDEPSSLFLCLLSSATFHSRLKTEPFKLSYPDSTPTTPHVRRHHR